MVQECHESLLGKIYFAGSAIDSSSMPSREVFVRGQLQCKATS
jgi:hypothetical protein